MPCTIAAGAAQLIVGSGLRHRKLYRCRARRISLCVGWREDTESVCVPALSTVPAAGEYTKVPGTLAVASNWVLLTAAPYVIAAGAFQVIKGVLFDGAAVMVTCVDALRVLRRHVSQKGDSRPVLSLISRVHGDSARRSCSKCSVGYPGESRIRKRPSGARSDILGSAITEMRHCPQHGRTSYA